jgi:hypothetical protein
MAQTPVTTEEILDAAQERMQWRRRPILESRKRA